MTRHLLAASLVALLLLTSACTDDDGAVDPSPSAGTTETSPTSDPSTSPAAPSATPTAAPTAPPPSATPDQTTSATPTEEPLAFEPYTVEVGREMFDATGEFSMRLRSIEVRPDGFVVDIATFNSTDKPIVLASEPGATFVLDPTERRYDFRPPADNPDLRFAPGEELTAKVAFPASFDEPPVFIQVVFNYDRDDVVPLAPDAAGNDVYVGAVGFGQMFLSRS